MLRAMQLGVSGSEVLTTIGRLPKRLEEPVTAFQLDRPASTDENDIAPWGPRRSIGAIICGFFLEVIENCQTEQHQ